MRFGLVAVVCLAVSGCSQSNGPVIAVSGDQPLRPQVAQFLLQEAIASSIWQACFPKGIQPSGTTEMRLRQFAGALSRAGYTADQVSTALDSLSIDELGPQAVRYVESQGGVEGDVNSICEVGRKEIAANSPIGQRLRIVR